MKTGSKQVFNEINITPLTDIFLVLLIIMMVVAPMMQQVRKDIKPPSLQSGAPVEQNKLTVEIAKDGQIYVQGQQANPDQLTETLKTEEAKLVSTAGSATVESAAANPEQPAEKNIIIRADKATKSGQVLKIFEAARDAGFTKVTVAGEPLQEARQEELRQTSMGGRPLTQEGA
ncbi:ExbD/TolR family protein [Vampirovibrio chlorellavorus]|uniref:ExbD/TolR family protein n=1 Tax=Vampirovibrio chlorellavorus TaxID=758823 RepID=UPI0026EF11E9|nr:biopolymer transporter ExbD [Vampirovibrio chlorellavorus]